METKEYRKTIEILSDIIDTGKVTSVLDFGCLNLDLLIELLHRFEVEKLFAVDKVDSFHYTNSEVNKVVKELEAIDPNHDFFKEERKIVFNDDYHYYFRYCLMLNVIAKDENTFKNIFHLFPNTEIRENLASLPKEKFDLIICSKIISHLDIDRIESINSLYQNYLNPGGIMFLRLNSKSFDTNTEVEQIQGFSESEILTIAEMINCIPEFPPYKEKAWKDKFHFILIGRKTPDNRYI